MRHNYISESVKKHYSLGNLSDSHNRRVGGIVPSSRRFFYFNFEVKQ